MIDMHTHILYDIDDGSKDKEMSFAILKNAVENGITDIVLTPHFSKPRNYRMDKKELRERFEIFQKEVKEEGIEITLHLGHEVDYHKEINQCLSNNKCLTLGNSNYLLVDFTFEQKNIDDYIYELGLKGYKVVVAHPERYKSKNLIEDIKTWRKTGAMIQLDASSMYLSKALIKISKKLLKEKLVDLIASDTHRYRESYTKFKEVCNYIGKKFGKEYLELMTITNPKKILN